ncbi:hypothetical protein [Paraconexibacter sp.]|uniref:hypothetical protein n=1 Tax=Paraconexibacter sp. TaxID=2949640 RepID=UPI0035627C94
MLARRLLLFASLVLLSAAFASALTTTTTSEDSGSATAPVVPSTGTGTERVRGELPARKPVLASVGDVVELDVSSDVADRVEIRDLGVEQSVEADAATTVVVIADRTGTFPISLRLSGERIGTLEVRDP